MYLNVVTTENLLQSLTWRIKLSITKIIEKNFCSNLLTPRKELKQEFSKYFCNLQDELFQLSPLLHPGLESELGSMKPDR